MTDTATTDTGKKGKRPTHAAYTVREYGQDQKEWLKIGVAWHRTDGSPTREGWLYLAAVEDLYSRRVVGWAMDERIDSRLVAAALAMAVRRRCPGAGLVAHSDRGSQYASDHYRRLPAGRGITCSMSRRGNCWDNAPMESSFASLKKELVHGEDYRTRAAAPASVFEYIEVFYNRVRRHSAPGSQPPGRVRTGRLTLNPAPALRGEVQP
jgi:transposase InsO family protein